MSSKPVTVWCVVRPSGFVLASTASRYRTFSVRGYITNHHPKTWKDCEREGYTVRKFKLVPVETKARGK